MAWFPLTLGPSTPSHTTTRKSTGLSASHGSSMLQGWWRTDGGGEGDHDGGSDRRSSSSMVIMPHDWLGATACPFCTKPQNTAHISSIYIRRIQVS